MKRASFTLFQPQRWMSLGQSTLMVLFVWCCLGINTASAQTKMPSDAKPVTKTFTAAECTAKTEISFTDDGDNDGNYGDPTKADGSANPRRDTVTFCPDDAWTRVYVEFTSIDIEANDSLVAYDGDYAAVKGSTATRIDAATGQGASQMNGGWVRSSCDPVSSPSGCLTFLFYTDGTNTKGAGWTANARCEARTAELTLVDIVNPKITCDDITTAREASADVTITAPAVKLCGETATIEQDSVIITVKNQKGEVCLDTTLTAAGAAKSVTEKFGIGAYLVNYTLKADQHESKQKNTSFTVQAPSLICNDNVEIPFGSACAIQLTPDDLLENPCDTIDGVLSYTITIKLGEGKNAKELTTVGGVYPTISASDLAAAGMTVCNATATATVERTIAAAGDCNNGPQNASCTTTLSFNDQSKPFITLGEGVDTLIACAGDEDALGELVKKTASAIDNCDKDVAIAVKSVVIAENDPCMASDGDAAKKGETTATIVITATDDCGNVGEISRTVVLIRPNLNDHLVKVGDDTRDCNDTDNSSSVPGLQVGSVKNGVFTVSDTVKLSDNEYICGYRLTKRDVNIPGTDCGKKIYRYWSVIDWCTPEVGPSVVDTSFIEFTDTKAPTFDNDTDQVTAAADIELGPFDCTYDINEHAKPAASDNCGLKEVVLHKVFRIEDGSNWEIEDKADWAKLDCDSFRLMYIARDLCHEQLLEDTTRQIVVIKDVTNPSAICTDELNVSVPTDAGARIHYSDIDAGSYDACGIKKIEVRKQLEDGSYTAWGETVDIVCEDVHRNPVIEMRVTDNKDNTNVCWMSVTVDDKIAPICGDLPTRDFTCDEFVKGELGIDTGGEYVELTGDLLNTYNTKFGNPADQCSDNLGCGPLTMKQYYKLTELTCGAMDIDRKWTVTDWSDKTSNEGSQHIDVDYVANWTLNFPADVDLTCNDGFPGAATADQIISNGSCDLWALEVSEKTFTVPGDICMKIERTYELINWCVYDAGDDAESVDRDGGKAVEVTSEGNEDKGRYTYVQILKLYGGDAPSIEIVDDVQECIYGAGDLEPFGMADDGTVADAYECDTLRTFSATGMNCAEVALGSDNFSWTFTPDGGTPVTGTGSSFSASVSPKTKYTVEFVVSDGCGNSSSAKKEYEFKDCKKPTPYVLHGLAIEIMQTGSIQLWASDLNQGSYDNCTVKDKLKYRLFKGDPVDGPQNIDDILALDENVTFECPIFGLQSVSFYVIDECNNWDVVGTYVSVQTNNGACSDSPDDMGRVAGKITNALGENVELVNVSVNGGDNTMATGANGEYQFALALEGDYTITPEKNINHLNGVSTYDLVLISKHILGIQAFDSPYKYIAADVNKSGTITAFDMVQLRQLILNITSEFSNNSSWRFVDAKHEFTTENPAGENFDEFMNINNLDGQMLNVDFIATKIGDVNGNAQSNSLLGAESRTTNGTLTLNVTDRFVEAGQTVTVDFAAADIAATQGYQFTMNFAGLDLVELNEGVAKAANFNTSLAKRGVLTTSWNGQATDENLFSLTFTANTNGLLSELVSVNSDITTAEAYNTAGELLDVAINFNSNNVSAAFDLSQNTPNPFNGETLIGFNLPQAGTATLKVMDVQGKVLTVISKEGVKGYNQVTLNAKTLGATGVLYYQLESADNIATKKMIIID